jgi:uncharacterized protein (TIGR03083 family)
MELAWKDSREAFTDAADWFLDVADRVGDRWERPGLGEWDVRALVGHTSRSFLTVEEYLGRPAGAVEIPSTADYYRATSAIAAGPAVAQRGRDAGTALGDDPPSALRAMAARVLPLVDSCDGTERVTSIVGGMRLSDYLPTRTFELTVHTCDLALALDEPLDVPSSAAALALSLVSRLALDTDRAGGLLLLATGRTGLPSGFTVL